MASHHWSATNTWTAYDGGTRRRPRIHDSTVNCLRSGWPVAASKVLLKVSPPKNRHVRTEQLLEIHRSLARRPPWLLQDPRPGPLEGSRLRTDRTRRDPFVVSSVSERCFNRDFFSRSPVLLHTLKVSPEIVMFRVRPFLLVTRTSKWQIPRPRASSFSLPYSIMDVSLSSEDFVVKTSTPGRLVLASLLASVPYLCFYSTFNGISGRISMESEASS